LTTPVIDILETLIGFDTTSRNSNLELMAWVEKYLNDHGVTAERVYAEEGRKVNLWATIGPKDIPGYVLSGHTDTVPVDGQDWSTDPFKLTQKGDRLYGRGTCDMKGFDACVLAMVPEMVAADLKRPIHIAFTHDEESGMAGVKALLQDIDRLTSVKPIACFVGEPTSMRVVVAHKGKSIFRAIVRGKPAHSSLAPKAVNAIDYAADLVLKVREMERRFEKEGPFDPLYDVGHSTAHTGTIAGGTALNIVPERCEFIFEFRLLPGLDIAPYEEELRSYIRDELEPRMHAIDPATGIDLICENELYGFDTAIDSEPALLAKRFAGQNDHTKVAYGTEAGFFVTKGGFPSVVIGPGSIEQAHAADEYVEIAQLEKCLAFIGRLIEHSAI
jgi:acetylornithine deacetylase